MPKVNGVAKRKAEGDANINLNVFATVGYGPYAGWTPVALTTGWNNFSYVLFNNVDGEAAIFIVDPNLNFVNAEFYGPYAGWTAQSLSTGTNLTEIKLAWQSTSGELAVFGLGAEALLINYAIYGPYSGWSPSSEALRKSAQAAKREQSSNKVMPLQMARSRAQAVNDAALVMKQHSHAVSSNPRML